VSPFKILGLAETASSEEVKQAFRRLAAVHHPDKGGLAEDFDRYRQAYETALIEAEAPKPCEACQGAGRIMKVNRMVEDRFTMHCLRWNRRDEVRPIIPPMPSISKDATKEERQAAFYDYCDKMHEANPSTCLPRGEKKGWKFWLIEHPATKEIK